MALCGSFYVGQEKSALFSPKGRRLGMKRNWHSFAMLIAIFLRSLGGLTQAQIIVLSHLSETEGCVSLLSFKSWRESKGLPRGAMLRACYAGLEDVECALVTWWRRRNVLWYGCDPGWRETVSYDRWNHVVLISVRKLSIQRSDDLLGCILQRSIRLGVFPQYWGSNLFCLRIWRPEIWWSRSPSILY